MIQGSDLGREKGLVLHNVKTDFGADPASYSVGTGVLFRG
jgi:hypothetical protein